MTPLLLRSGEYSLPLFVSNSNKYFPTTQMCTDSMERNRSSSCPTTGVCSRVFRLAVFNNQLFAITMKNAVLDMLKMCCGDCFRCDVKVCISVIQEKLRVYFVKMPIFIYLESITFIFRAYVAYSQNTYFHQCFIKKVRVGQVGRILIVQRLPCFPLDKLIFISVPLISY